MAEGRSKAKKGGGSSKAQNEVPINITYQDEVDYEVEEILQHDEINGQTFYLIRWKNYDESWNSWEPSTLLDNCPEKLKEYRLKAGIPLAATVKLTPDKHLSAAAGSSSSASTAQKKGSQNITARKSGVKRKLLNPGPSKQETSRSSAKKTHISISPNASATAASSSQSSSSSPSKAAAGSSKGPPAKPQILEVLDDGTDRRMVSILLPGREEPALMWYSDIKDKYPSIMIDFLESHIKFKKTGCQEFVLVDPY